MKMIQNKNLIQKILLLLLVVVSFNFICPSVVNAADTTSLGGAVVEGIADLLTALGDGILNIIHRFAMGQDETLIHLTGSIWNVIGNILIMLVCVVLAGFIAYLTAGLGSHISMALLGVGLSGVTIAKFVALGAVTGAIWTYGNLPDNTLDLPVYSISPEEIFYGKVPLLNVNFFNPDKRKDIYDETMTSEDDVSNQKLSSFLGYYDLFDKLKNRDCYYYKVSKELEGSSWTGIVEEWKYNGIIYRLKYEYKATHSGPGFQEINYTKNGTKENLTSNDLINLIGFGNFNNPDETYKLASQGYAVTMNEDVAVLKQYSSYITGNNQNAQVKWEDSLKNQYTLTITNGKKTLTTIRAYTNIESDLQPVVSKWYVTLRNVALVMSMSILVYVGIRMMLTSIASEKAKYKNMLVDWLIGVALIFVMQYIMVFATALNDEFIDLVSSLKAGEQLIEGTEVYIPGVYIEKDPNIKWDKVSPEAYVEKDGWVFWPTNLMGNVRVGLQNMRGESFLYIGYVILFLVLVFYTAFFIFTYLKRVLYMAFLTVIAPFVAMTYPIDKLNDGKAQAFNMWIKEYIFNLLIQPMHLLLYHILIISSTKLATENVIYALVAIGFMIPAEKLIRKFFGFDKAQTPGFLGGAAGAGIVMSAVGSLRRFSSGGKGGSKDESNKDVDGKIRTKSTDEKLDPHKLFGDGSESSDNNQENIRMNGNSETPSSVQAKSVEEHSSETTRSFTEIAEETNKEITKSEKTTKATPNNETKNDENKDSSSDKKTPIRRRITGALTGVAVGGARTAGRLVGKIPNLAARGLGAATLGAVGLAAGIATGDAGNALQYALTGAGAGSALGSGISNRANNAFDNVTEDWMRGWYGGDYNTYANKKSDERFLRSKENRDFYKSMFGDDYRDRMEEAVKHYRSRGITDNKIIAKAMKLKGGYSVQERVFIADLASKVKTTSDWEKTRNSFKNIGISEDKINRIEKAVVSINKLPIQSK